MKHRANIAFRYAPILALTLFSLRIQIPAGAV
jgi:hypothetical protein